MVVTTRVFSTVSGTVLTYWQSNVQPPGSQTMTYTFTTPYGSNYDLFYYDDVVWSTYDATGTSTKFTVPSRVNGNMVFKGWYTTTEYKASPAKEDFSVLISSSTTITEPDFANVYGTGDGGLYMGAVCAVYEPITVRASITLGEGVGSVLVSTYTGSGEDTQSQTIYASTTLAIEVGRNYSLAAYAGTGYQNVRSTGDSTEGTATEGVNLNFAFVAEKKTYTVTLQKQTGVSDAQTVTVKWGDPMPTVTPPTRVGYGFNGYYRKVDTSGQTQYIYYYSATGESAKAWDVDSNETLAGGWTAFSCKIRYDANGGIGTMSDTDFTYGGSGVIAVNGFTRTGHTFAGWAVSADGEAAFAAGAYANGVVDLLRITTAAGAQNITLYAAWTANPYTISFDPNGGTVQGIGEGEAVPTKAVTYGEAYGDLPVPVKSGYAFTGWLEPGADEIVGADSIVAITEDTELVAQWGAKTVTFTLDATDGRRYDPASAGSASATWTYGETRSAITPPTMEDFSFTGYFAESNGGGVCYFAADGSATDAEIGWDALGASTGITLYAKWVRELHTITFNTDGGSAVALVTQSYDELVNVPYPPYKNGYEFTGWSPRIPRWMPKEDITVVAQWTPCYVVTFSAGSTYGDDMNEPTFTMNKLPGEPLRFDPRRKFTFKEDLASGYAAIYEQVGWTTHSDRIMGDGRVDYPLDGEYAADANIALYPVFWERVGPLNAVLVTIVEDVPVVTGAMPGSIFHIGGAWDWSHRGGATGSILGWEVNGEYLGDGVLSFTVPLSSSSTTAVQLTPRYSQNFTPGSSKYVIYAPGCFDDFDKKPKANADYLNSYFENVRWQEILSSVSIRGREYYRPGYVQVAWTDKTGGAITTDSDIGTRYEFTDTYPAGGGTASDLVLYPLWQEQSYGISCDLGNGEMPDDALTVPSAAAWTEWFALRVPEADGEVFGGWQVQGAGGYCIPENYRSFRGEWTFCNESEYVTILEYLDDGGDLNDILDDLQIVVNRTNFTGGGVCYNEDAYAYFFRKLAYPWAMGASEAISDFPDVEIDAVWKSPETRLITLRMDDYASEMPNSAEDVEESGVDDSTGEAGGRILKLFDSDSGDGVEPVGEPATATDSWGDSVTYTFEDGADLNAEPAGAVRVDGETEGESVNKVFAILTDWVSQRPVLRRSDGGGRFPVAFSAYAGHVSYLLSYGALIAVRAGYTRGSARTMGTVSVEGGTATSDGQFISALVVCGDVATVRAKPRGGYSFVGWYRMPSGDRGFLYSRDATLEIVVKEPVTLYARFEADPNGIYAWDSGETGADEGRNKLMEWRSKTYVASKPFDPVSVRIDSTGYPPVALTVDMYSSPDEEATASATLGNIASQDARRLPRLRPERYMQIEVKHDEEVDAILVGTSMGGLAV